MGEARRRDPAGPVSYLRLASLEHDEDSHRGRGVITQAYEIRRSGRISAEDEAILESLIRWFERNLPFPDRSRLVPRAIFWFKPEAVDSASRACELARCLARSGLGVEVLRTRHPGRIVYEDEAQVAAIPFRDTFDGAKRRGS